MFYSGRGWFNFWESALVSRTLGSTRSGKEAHRLPSLSSLGTCLWNPLHAIYFWMSWECLPNIASWTPCGWVHQSLVFCCALTWIWNLVLATSRGEHTVTATNDAPRLARNRAFTLGGYFSIILNLKWSTIHAVRWLKLPSSGHSWSSALSQRPLKNTFQHPLIIQKFKPLQSQGPTQLA